MHVVRMEDGLNDPVYSVLVCSTLLFSVRRNAPYGEGFILLEKSSLLPDDAGRAVTNL
jgi:hypothetical protein